MFRWNLAKTFEGSILQWKHIAKTIEGSSKAHFSHTRNKLEKSDPETPHFGKDFRQRIDPRSRKSGFKIVTAFKPMFFS